MSAIKELLSPKRWQKVKTSEIDDGSSETLCTLHDSDEEEDGPFGAPQKIQKSKSLGKLQSSDEVKPMRSGSLTQNLKVFISNSNTNENNNTNSNTPSPRSPMALGSPLSPRSPMSPMSPISPMTPGSAAFKVKVMDKFDRSSMDTINLYITRVGVCFTDKNKNLLYEFPLEKIKGWNLYDKSLMFDFGEFDPHTLTIFTTDSHYIVQVLVKYIDDLVKLKRSYEVSSPRAMTVELNKSA